jgi:hypothetical protein
LQDIGINHLPRHIRYDKCEDKFVIEKSHPGLNQLTTPFNRSGTKSANVSIIYKYYDILKKLETLNKLCETPEIIAFRRKQETLYKDYCDISRLITGNTTVNIINYDNTACDYTCLEKHLTDAEKEYERHGLPEHSTIDISALPKYCCYVKSNGKRGDAFYISRHHPHLKTILASDIKTTASKNVTLETKFNDMLATYDCIEKNQGDELKKLLSKRKP